MTVAATVYASSTHYGWMKGFYMAVSVGYSIGWGYPVEPNDLVVGYSIFHLLLGTIAIAAALSVYGSMIIDNDKEWYKKALRDIEFSLKQDKAPSVMHRIYVWATYKVELFLPVIVWLFWVLLGVVWSMCVVKWSFAKALYFSISSLSTGGLKAIPQESEEGVYLFGELLCVEIDIVTLTPHHV
jgi:hypothetical protein